MTPEQAKAEIMYLFRYFYNKTWAPDNIFKGKDRVWVKEFNRLVDQGFIKRKKGYPGFQYKWVAAWPEVY